MNDLTQEELWRLRAMIQKVGWLNFWNHVGSLMAEQADKVPRDSAQDKALFNMSNFMHNSGVQELVKPCGFFDYRKFDGDIFETPSEFKAIIDGAVPIVEKRS